MAGLWAGFIALILLLLAVDLGVFHRQVRTIQVRDALVWTGIWIETMLGKPV